MATLSALCFGCFSSHTENFFEGKIAAGPTKLFDCHAKIGAIRTLLRRMRRGAQHGHKVSP